MLQVQPAGSVPAETARIAHQVFPKGNRYLSLRDELGSIYSDRDFETLFPTHGQPAQWVWFKKGRFQVTLSAQNRPSLSMAQPAD